MNTRVEISIKTLLMAAVGIAVVWVLYLIKDILFLLFISFLLMTALEPLVARMESLRIPRFISIILLYFVLFGLLGAAIISSIPALVVQYTRLVEIIPLAIPKFFPYWNMDISTITQQLSPIGENILKVTVGIFSNIVATFTVLVFTFYLLLERKNMRSMIADVFGSTFSDKVIEILRAVESRLGDWVRGELILMATVGIVTFIGLSVLRVEFALPIAILAGLLEIIPNIGPVLSAIPAILVAFTTSPFLAMSVGALYIVVQQVENNILVPIVMKKSVGLSPLIIILALMTGAKLGGIPGAILAVPILLVVQALVMTVLAQSAQDKAKNSQKNSRLP